MSNYYVTSNNNNLKLLTPLNNNVTINKIQFYPNISVYTLTFALTINTIPATNYSFVHNTNFNINIPTGQITILDGGGNKAIFDYQINSTTITISNIKFKSSTNTDLLTNMTDFNLTVSIGAVNYLTTSSYTYLTDCEIILSIYNNKEFKVYFTNLNPYTYTNEYLNNTLVQSTNLLAHIEANSYPCIVHHEDLLITLVQTDPNTVLTVKDENNNTINCSMIECAYNISY